MTKLENNVIPSLAEFQKHFCTEDFQLLQWLLELRRENEVLKSQVALLQMELTTTMEMYSRLEKRLKELR